MSNSITKITTIEAVCLVVIITVNRIILNIPQLFLSKCGSSAILNSVYITVLAIVFTLILIKLFKKFSNSDIIDVSEFVGGKFLKNVVAIFLIIYLISISAVLLRNFAELIHIIYYGRTTIIYLILFFFGTVLISNFMGEQSIIKSNVVFTIIMISSLSITFLSVFPNIVWQRIFPILGYGTYETFFSGLSNILSFNGLLCLYFLIPLLSEKKDFKKISIVSVLIIGVLIVIATAALLLSLSFSSNVEGISPIYSLISNNEFGSFLQHPESLFVFTWILSIMSYLNVVVMFSIRFSKKIFNVKNGKLFIVPICFIIFLISLFPNNIIETQKIEEALYKYLSFPLTFIVLPIILIIANIKSKKGIGRKDSINE